MRQRHEKTVLFLCTGNYYRSRFAEVLFNSVAGKMGLPWRASSRGLALERGVNNVGPMAVAAVKALEARGLRGIAELARLPVAGDGGRFRRSGLDRRSEGGRTPAPAARALPGLGREGRILAGGRPGRHASPASRTGTPCGVCSSARKKRLVFEVLLVHDPPPLCCKIGDNTPR